MRGGTGCSVSPVQHRSPCPWVSVRAREEEEEETGGAKEPFQRAAAPGWQLREVRHRGKEEQLESLWREQG